jgi:RNA recognition motif-containing protein
LPKDLKNDKLYSMFIEFGNIVSSKIEEMPDGSSKGFGYV